MSVDSFKPEVWHAELRMAYEKDLVYVNFCNRDYEGDIAQMGDTVHIDTIGDVTVTDYVPGVTKIEAKALDTTDQTLVIDRCKMFAFKVDDVDKRQVRGNMMTAGMRKAAYGMKDEAAQYVAGMYAGVAPANTIAPRYIDSGDEAFESLIDLGLLLDEANVAQEGRWCAAPPWFFALLVTSKYVTNVAFSQANAAIQSGQVGELALQSSNIGCLLSRGCLDVGHRMGLLIAG